MNIKWNLSKYRLYISFFSNPLLVDIFLIGVILLLFTLIFNFCFIGIIHCDSISEVINITGSENECVYNNDEDSVRTGFEAPSSLLLKYKFIIRRKLYWFFKGYNSGEYTSYEEFKRAWRPEMSLRREFKDSFKNMMRDPRGDIARSRDKVNRVTENVRAMDARLAEKRRIQRMAEYNRDIDRLHRGLRK